MDRKRGWLWMLAGVIMALVAAALVYRILTAAAVVGPTAAVQETRPVVVLQEDVPAGTVITDTMVTLRDVPVDLVPEDAVVALEDAVGKVALTHLKAGEILLASRVETPTNITRNIALTIPSGMVAIALPAEDRLNRVGMLKPGDHVDILFTLDLTGSGVPASLRTFAALQNVVVRAIVLSPLVEQVEQPTGGGGGVRPREKVVVVAVDPQDALYLKYLIDAGAVLDFALRPPEDESAPPLEPVDLQLIGDLYGFDVAGVLAPATAPTPAVTPVP